jgi:hypothetical protein
VKPALVVSGLLALMVACSDPHATPAKPAFQVLEGPGTALRDAFNHDRGHVRLLFLMDPICPKA